MTVVQSMEVGQFLDSMVATFFPMSEDASVTGLYYCSFPPLLFKNTGQ